MKNFLGISGKTSAAIAVIYTCLELFQTSSQAVAAPAATAFKISTPRGVELNGFYHLPDGQTKAPLVIIGSGSGYHMGYTLTQGLAEKLAANGIAAIRFNWGFFGHGTYSPEYKNEIEDYETVLKFALAQPRTDAARIFAGGKSLGSLVAYRVFARVPQLKAAILMTPVCSDEDAAGKPISAMGETYPNIAQSDRAIIMVGGVSDPQCFTPHLFEALGKSRGQIVTVLFGGDHSMNIADPSKPGSAPANLANQDAAMNAILHWVRLLNF